MRWDGASRAGSVLAAGEDFYALLEVPRDASPEHIKKQVGRGQKCGDHLPTAARLLQLLKLLCTSSGGEFTSVVQPRYSTEG